MSTLIFSTTAHNLVTIQQQLQQLVETVFRSPQLLLRYVSKLMWVVCIRVSEQFLNGTSAYSVPFIHSVLFTVWQICIKVGYNQGYLATVKMNEKYILKIKREKNDHKDINVKEKSVRL